MRSLYRSLNWIFNHHFESSLIVYLIYTSKYIIFYCIDIYNPFIL